MNKVKIFKILSIICFFIAVICLGYEPAKSYLVNKYTPKITRSAISRSRNHRRKHISYNMSSVQPATMQRIINARTHSRQVSVVGQMLVPSVGLHLPINQGVSNNSLLLGAGTMKPHQKMGEGNYSLAGHHMINKSALFTPLWLHAHKGTQVYITDMHNIYTYKINVRKVISPYDIKVINNTRKPTLTLITCNNNGSKRLLLQGRLVKKSLLNKAPKLVIKDAKSKTNNHNVLKGY